MISLEDIRAYARQIADTIKPQKIILFGSYAYGTPSEHSDVDLMVILPFNEKPWKKASEVRLATPHPGFPLDIICQTPEAFEEALRLDKQLYKEVAEQGISLYEASGVIV